MPESPPPTSSVPSVPLAALLADRDLGLLPVGYGNDPEVIAAVEVRWVHTSEMSDPYPYLLGGELLLTAGVQLTEAHADTYVARVVEAGAAALGFGVTPVYDTVPAWLVAACDRHGLPLLEVPPRTPFTAVARGVWRLMAEARHRELRRVTRAQQGLAAAAARRDPVPAVLGQLAVRLGGHAALFAPDGTERQAAGRAPSPAAGERLGHLTHVVRAGGPTSATDTAGGAHLAAYALGGSEGLVLGVAARERAPGDHTVAGVAVVLLSLLTAPHQGAAEAGRSAALVRLLLGATPAETAPLLGPGPWTVIHARATPAAPDTPSAASALGAALGSALVDTDGATVRILTDRAVTPQPGWTLGTSAPKAPTDLPEANTEAAHALAHAVATRKPLVHHATMTTGETWGLSTLLPQPEARARARTLLAPLTGPLPETLHCWLSLHGSWDRTATTLSVHRNTVRQRIARCATLLNADLNDMDVRAELWLALRTR